MLHRRSCMLRRARTWRTLTTPCLLRNQWRRRAIHSRAVLVAALTAGIWHFINGDLQTHHIKITTMSCLSCGFVIDQFISYLFVIAWNVFVIPLGPVSLRGLASPTTSYNTSHSEPPSTLLTTTNNSHHYTRPRCVGSLWGLCEVFVRSLWGLC